ncbi:MAG: beta-lactamase family protein [Actinomycetia bacterium]|nr:beta-lactamase family protein [Actinomycetes bacterium]MCP4959895.1 beta-lactamase family protein [Actinomycetes bacterium]
MDAFELIDEWPVNNAACGVVHLDGRHWTIGDTACPFTLASVTKVLSAMAILVAFEEGIIDLDQPIGPPRSTLRHLLAHASGLAPDQRRLLTEPGRRRIYSNSAFEIAAEAVAAEAEMGFSEYFAQGVAEPLGMSNTTLDGSPAHGARGTVDDLLLVAGELLGATSNVLAPTTVAAMTSPVFPDLPGVLPGYGLQDPNTWGLGVEIRSTKQPHWTGENNSPQTFGHFGKAGTFIWADPDARVACVVLTDREFGEWAITRWPAFSDAVLDNL